MAFLKKKPSIPPAEGSPGPKESDFFSQNSNGLSPEDKNTPTVINRAGPVRTLFTPGPKPGVPASHVKVPTSTLKAATMPGARIKVTNQPTATKVVPGKPAGRGTAKTPTTGPKTTTLVKVGPGPGPERKRVSGVLPQNGTKSPTLQLPGPTPFLGEGTPEDRSLNVPDRSPSPTESVISVISISSRTSDTYSTRPESMSPPGKLGKGNVRVCVRFRPEFGPRDEKEDPPYFRSPKKNPTFVWNLDDTSVQFEKEKNVWKFDKVFSPPTQTYEVYKEMLLPLVENVTQGFNGTVFAYGQTNSGKTHTMFGDQHGKGVLEHSIDQLFEITHKMKTDQPGLDVLLHASFFQIYNEKIYDLLEEKKVEKKKDSASNPGTSLRLKQVSTGAWVVEGVVEVPVTSGKQVMELLLKGYANRALGKSFLNEQSSRSHAIFRLEMQSGFRDSNDSKRKLASVKVSELNFVDLAGSETLDDTKGQKAGEETKKINLSLTHLKSVIRTLSLPQAPKLPGMYRNSVLTMVLANSLGGNAKTVVICAASPLPSLKANTRSTLEFGAMARAVKNEAKINEVGDTNVKLKKFQERIRGLEAKCQEHETEKKKFEEYYKSKVAELTKKLAEFKQQDEEQRKVKTEIQEFESKNLVVATTTATLPESTGGINDEDLKKLQSEFDELKAANKNLQAQLEAQKKEKAQAETLQKQLEEELKIQQESKKQAEKDQKDLEIQLQKQRDANQTAEEEKKKLEEALRLQREQKKEAETHHQRLTKQLEEQEAANNARQKELAEDLRAAKERAMQERTSLEAQLRDQEEAKRQAERDQIQLQTQLREAKALAEKEQNSLLKQQQDAKAKADEEQRRLQAQLREYDDAKSKAEKDQKLLQTQVEEHQKAKELAQKEQKLLQEQLKQQEDAKKKSDEEQQALQAQLKHQKDQKEIADGKQQALVKQLHLLEEANQKVARDQERLAKEKESAEQEQKRLELQLQKQEADKKKAEQDQQRLQAQLQAQLQEQKQAKDQAEKEQKALHDQLKEQATAKKKADEEQQNLLGQLKQQEEAKKRADEESSALLKQLKQQEEAKKKAEAQQKSLHDALQKQQEAKEKADKQHELLQQKLLLQEAENKKAAEDQKQLQQTLKAAEEHQKKLREDLEKQIDAKKKAEAEQTFMRRQLDEQKKAELKAQEDIRNQRLELEKLEAARKRTAKEKDILEQDFARHKLDEKTKGVVNDHYLAKELENGWKKEDKIVKLEQDLLSQEAVLKAAHAIEIEKLKAQHKKDKEAWNGQNEILKDLPPDDVKRQLQQALSELDDSKKSETKLKEEKKVLATEVTRLLKKEEDNLALIEKQKKALIEAKSPPASPPPKTTPTTPTTSALSPPASRVTTTSGGGGAPAFPYLLQLKEMQPIFSDTDTDRIKAALLECKGDKQRAIERLIADPRETKNEKPKANPSSFVLVHHPPTPPSGRGR